MTHDQTLSSLSRLEFWSTIERKAHARFLAFSDDPDGQELATRSLKIKVNARRMQELISDPDFAWIYGDAK